MKTRAAVLWGLHQDWQVEEIEVDPPKAGEVLVEWKAAGLCHCDEHLVTGDMVPPAEVLAADGRRPTSSRSSAATRAPASSSRSARASRASQPGDHVSASFVPSCGRCRYCSTGRQNLCDHGAGTLVGGHDHRRHAPPLHVDGTADHAVRQARHVRRARRASPRRRSSRSTTDLPLEAVALVSCGVATGWGSADEPRRGAARRHRRGGRHRRHRHQRRAGRARWPAPSRVIAVDPVEFKREKAMEFGATHTFASMEEAIPAVTELTLGPDGRQGDHDAGRDVRRPDGARHDAGRQGRHDRRHRRRPDDADRVGGQPVRAGHVEQGDQGHDLRLAQPARRHPQAARPVPRGPAQARRADHQPLPARRDQRGLPGDARRREHPRRHRAWY